MSCDRYDMDVYYPVRLPFASGCAAVLFTVRRPAVGSRETARPTMKGPRLSAIFEVGGAVA